MLAGLFAVITLAAFATMPLVWQALGAARMALVVAALPPPLWFARIEPRLASARAAA